MNTYYVYILTNKNNTAFYIGVTNDLERRMWQHKNLESENSFSYRYALTKLIYLEETENIEEAIEREKQLKNWKRQWKIELIESQNPYWRDLSGNWE